MSHIEHVGQSPTFFQNIALGITSGLVAVPVMQPLLYGKNTAQAIARERAEGKVTTVFSKSPQVWYRGTVGFALSFGPTVALQTSLNTLFSNRLDSMCSSILSGMVTTCIEAPAERVQNEQQIRGTPLARTIREIYARSGLKGFTKGFVPTAIREGGFSCAYLGAAPMLKEWLVLRGYSDTRAKFWAGIYAGTAACLITHPFDTRKTQIQRGYELKRFTFKSCISKEAFAGFGWRLACIDAAAVLMFFTQEEIKKQIIIK